MEITVPVLDKTDVLMLRNAVGDGHCEGYEISLQSNIPDASLVIQVDGKQYVVNSHAVVQAVVAAHIQEKQNATA